MNNSSESDSGDDDARLYDRLKQPQKVPVPYVRKIKQEGDLFHKVNETIAFQAQQMASGAYVSSGSNNNSPSTSPKLLSPTIPAVNLSREAQKRLSLAHQKFATSLIRQQAISEQEKANPKLHQYLLYSSEQDSPSPNPDSNAILSKTEIDSVNKVKGTSSSDPSKTDNSKVGEGSVDPSPKVIESSSKLLSTQKDDKVGNEGDKVKEFVIFNVGGKLFHLSSKLLRREAPTSILTKCLIIGESQTELLLKDPEGHYFIDRSPEYFELLLYFIRDKIWPPVRYLQRVIIEADYLNMKPVAQKLRQFLANGHKFRDDMLIKSVFESLDGKTAFQNMYKELKAVIYSTQEDRILPVKTIWLVFEDDKISTPKSNELDIALDEISISLAKFVSSHCNLTNGIKDSVCRSLALKLQQDGFLVKAINKCHKDEIYSFGVEFYYTCYSGLMAGERVHLLSARNEITSLYNSLDAYEDITSDLIDMMGLVTN